MLLLEMVVCGIAPIILIGPQIAGISIWMLALGVAFTLVIATYLAIRWAQGWDTERDHYATGQAGEARLIDFLQAHLDAQWTVYRNVVLPGRPGDIDAVLVGPGGVYALEVKTYTGYYRNQNLQWAYRKAYGIWRPARQNPSRQARGSAKRLSDYFKTQGVDIYVYPRVVWAGSGRVTLEKPKVPIWQLSKPDWMLEDMRRTAKKVNGADVRTAQQLLRQLPQHH